MEVIANPFQSLAAVKLFLRFGGLPLRYRSAAFKSTVSTSDNLLFFLALGETLLALPTNALLDLLGSFYDAHSASTAMNTLSGACLLVAELCRLPIPYTGSPSSSQGDDLISHISVFSLQYAQLRVQCPCDDSSHRVGCSVALPTSPLLHRMEAAGELLGAWHKTHFAWPSI